MRQVIDHAFFCKKIDVLEHGYVELIDFMGSDASIVAASRVSTGNESDLKDVDKIRKSIRFMMKDGFKHTIPFEQAELIFKIKMPIYLSRQFNRYRTASIVEMSGRYKEMNGETNIEICEDEFYEKCLTPQTLTVEDRERLYARYIEKNEDTSIEIFNRYREMLKDGIKRETARNILPLSTYTEEIFKIDLKNLLNLIEQRTSPHAHYEAQAIANAIVELITPLFPITVSEFYNNVINSVIFSSDEIKCLKSMNVRVSTNMCENLTKAEFDRFNAKLEKIFS